MAVWPWYGKIALGQLSLRDAVDELNREIAALQKQHALPPRPDLAAWFDANPHQLDGDGRPDPEGRQAIRRLWEEALDVFYVPQ